MEKITADDLVTALLEAQAAESPDGVLTTADLAEKLGRNRKWVRVKIAQLKKAGRVKCVWVQGKSISDRPVTVPAYRLVDGSEDK